MKQSVQRLGLGREGIFVAETEAQLAEVMRAAQTGRPAGAVPAGSADPTFIARIRDFIDGAAPPDDPR